jgi:hypothetical protein
MSRTLKVSSSAVAKTIKRYEETGSHEDRQLPLLQRISSLELPAPQITAQINASEFKKHINKRKLFATLAITSANHAYVTNKM